MAVEFKLSHHPKNNDPDPKYNDEQRVMIDDDFTGLPLGIDNYHANLSIRSISSVADRVRVDIGPRLVFFQWSRKIALSDIGGDRPQIIEASEGEYKEHTVEIGPGQELLIRTECSRFNTELKIRNHKS